MQKAQNTVNRTWALVHDQAEAASRRDPGAEQFVTRHPEGGFQFSATRPTADSTIIAIYKNGRLIH